MRRRPQPSRRRGFLRAAIAVLALTALILIALLVVSTLTASPAKAPTVPSTPTPTKTRATPTGTATGKGGKPTSTHKDVSMAPVHGQSPILHERSFEPRAARFSWPAGAVAAPMGSLVAYFRRVGDATSRNPLLVRDKRTGHEREIGYGDPFLRPVWSPDGRSLLYVRAASTNQFPGARWSLEQADLEGHSRTLAQHVGLALLPLGWSERHVLFLVTSATDTSLFAVADGRAHFISILVPQSVTSGLLSPDREYVAFAAPASCGSCTIDAFNIKTQRISYGPSGGLSESDMAWTSDSSRLVASVRGRLAIIDPATGNASYAPLPAGLPRIWAHAVRPIMHGTGALLVDTVTGARYGAAGLKDSF